ncbi:pumilio-family RNA binding protein [Kwoniella mangroviensis CBS 10435]|uniref:Pumilio-family RNA binding protein n=1 Tax=Kwoniella mangroviensis CBS 10435 TaxID=1331196 RepID=A0A1B9IJR7_9TREE|nr:pumilio-family RNA binding protein [Kwoniella mangroviensis CBS 8507]OCF55610.1 pumilio-family RNA binding protein [Kwoniella mangroviensis CBS 10435]OCF63233.1 pumilio-family RNA binding protein [Kwoniella mangroviensis CBS 8507]OCF73658.1 pumilio-family RNA binding protein [Kwoniella mangroviensis CBS 8886]
MTTDTTSLSPTAPTTRLNVAATQSDPELNKLDAVNGKLPNGHDALDLADSAQHADKLEAKRLEHERQRHAQRARFEQQMQELEASQLAEERQLLNGNTPAGEAASAPTTPPGRLPHGTTASVSDNKEAPAPIGPPGREREGLNGAKSMPGSRRTSTYGGTFGMEKLSLSVMADAGRRDWTEDDDVDAEGAQSSVKYLQMGDDDPFPGIPKSDNKRLSTASAALDLAPLSQTPPRAFGSRPFETSLKTSEWPQFSAVPATANANTARGMTSPLPGQGLMSDDGRDPILGSRKTSPTGMADSIASLPAMPSKSVPATPFGFNSISGAKRAPGPQENAGEGLSHAQRGFSNPDLARAFGKVGGGFSMNEAGRPYDAYNAFPPSGAFNPQTAYDPYGFDDDGYGSGALYPGGSIGLKNKRADQDREFNRFTGVRIEDIQGELLPLCKDQHGCRYLQKKLEDGDPKHRDMIFNETYGHFPELMTDPFGNYLCQKLLEYSTEEQRSAIIDSVANDLVGISLNMHGTRAVQKMVDFLAQPRQAKQIRTLIMALSLNVVALIKDLNGNHVIQKCLNKLIPEDNQFIYNAIAANLIEVATHRHGCCVLQRSIDHASPAQRMQLVTEIIFNSLYLVQDPFGNYVIQYILDLNDARFSEPLIRTFIGNVCSLSVQKFSSNVVEKCVRVADPEVRKGLVGECLNRSRLEKLLRDSYGNYVIQTILDYCDIGQRMLLVELIRPILPSIRNTPYGKRIQSKLAREDASFSPYGQGNGYGGNGGGGGGGRGYGRGGYHGSNRGHIGRPQLQHVNALTDIYGGGGPFMQYGGGHMHPGQAHFHGGERGGPGGPPPPQMGPTHTGMSYHAPGPDGQPWLHLRGPTGGPAPNWHLQDGPGGPPHPHGPHPGMQGQQPPSVETNGAEVILPEESLVGGAGVPAGNWQDQQGQPFVPYHNAPPMM